MTGNVAQVTLKPPYFDGIKGPETFPIWEARIKAHLMEIGYDDLVDVVEGDAALPNTDKAKQMNRKFYYILIRALDNITVKIIMNGA